jgi:chromate transporter
VKLVRTSTGRDPLLWGLVAVNAVVTASLARELVLLVLASGLLALLVKAPPRFKTTPAAAVALLPAAWLVSGLSGPATGTTLLHIGAYFAEAGSFVFGSGLAIIPFLHGGVVEHFHWLDDRQFLDAVAVAMITPGPVVITVAFIGYLVAGPAGALVAALGVFLPCWGLVVLLAPSYRRFAGNRSIKAFVQGVTAAATGAIAGAVWVLGRRSIDDLPTILIALAALALLVRFKKLPEPVVILAAGAAGIAIH